MQKRPWPDFPQNIAPISEYFSDLENGTLPQVAEIYAASDAGLDEHGSDTDAHATNVQDGARYTSTLVNALMNSSSWEDSAFIFFFDESGGLYDHVAPQPTVSPDGIPPSDLPAGYICTGKTGPISNFTYTGYRIPMTVISPYSKKNYVSHTVMDSTAILKFIETRFNLPAAHQARCRSAGYDGVLRFQQSAVDVSADASSAKHEEPVLLEQTTLGKKKKQLVLARCLVIISSSVYFFI